MDLWDKGRLYKGVTDMVVKKAKEMFAKVKFKARWVFAFKVEPIIKRFLTPISVLLMTALKFGRVKVKFCAVEYARIGHLAVNTEVFLRRLNNGSFDAGYRYVGVSGKPCNQQLMKMIKREIPVFQSKILSGIIKTPIFNRSVFFETMSFNNREYHELNDLPQVVHFNDEEKERGIGELQKMGITPGDWFVCFHNRDSKYLDRVYGFKDWSYHDHRDCDISNFVPAMEYIASLGGYAIRIGQHMEGKMEVKNDPRIIDYASNFRSDFMDIFLPSYCKFFVGNTAGPFVLATIAGRPVVMTNSTPTELTPFRRGDLFIPKKIWDKNNERFLTFREIYERGISSYACAQQFVENELTLIENESNEILSVVKEMNSVLDGCRQYGEEDECRQKKYWSFVKPSHACYGSPARIGNEFLEQNDRMLE